MDSDRRDLAPGRHLEGIRRHGVGEMAQSDFTKIDAAEDLSERRVLEDQHRVLVGLMELRGAVVQDVQQFQVASKLIVPGLSSRQGATTCMDRAEHDREPLLVEAGVHSHFL